MWNYNRTLYHAAVWITQSCRFTKFNQKAQFVGLIANTDARLLKNKSNDFVSQKIKLQGEVLQKTSAAT